MSTSGRPIVRRSARNATLPALLTVLAVLTSWSIGRSPDVSAQTDDEPADATLPPGPVTPGGIQLRLIDQSFDVEPGDDIELTYLLTGDLEGAELTPPTEEEIDEPATRGDEAGGNDGTANEGTGDDGATDEDAEQEPVPPVPVQAAVTNFVPVERIDQIERAIGPDVRRAPLLPAIDGVLIDVRPLITVGEGPDADTAVLELSVPTDIDPSEAERLEFEETGLHPIIVELRVGGEVVAAHGTIIDRRDDDLALPTVDLSVLTAIEDPGPSGTLEELRADIDALDRTADVALELEAPLTMSIPPNVARIATESSTRNVLPTAFADDELISTPATPFDISSAVAVDRIDAFANQLTFGEDQLRAAFPSTAVRRDAWLVTSPISAEATIELRDRAVRYMIFPADLYRRTISDELPATDRFVEIDLGNGTSMPILVIDELGAAFTRRATSEILESTNPTEWSIGAISRLRFEQYDAPPSARDAARSRILATPDLTEPDPRLLVELERLAERTSAIRFSAASELTGVTSTQTVSEELAFPATAGPDLSERLELINLTIVSLASVDSMLADDDPRFPEWQRQLDGFVSTAYEDDEVTAAIDEILAEADAIRDGVIPPDPISFTLTGNEGTIDLNVGNRLDEPITVVLRLSSPRLSFPDGDRTITLPPESTQTIQVPVRARSNGTSSVEVDILTPSGDPLIETVTLQSRVNSLTGLGQALTAGLVLILLTWWFSHWRRRRRTENASADPS